MFELAPEHEEIMADKAWKKKALSCSRIYQKRKLEKLKDCYFRFVKASINTLSWGCNHGET